MRLTWTPVLFALAWLLLGCTPEARSAGRSEAGGRTVVLELFTSQGCSSCPPADRLLSRLRREGVDGHPVIPLAYHVDYWDHLGWSDPFSSPRWSQRQRTYASTLRDHQVYTPQLVVNGTAQLIGSSEGAVRREIQRQLREADRGWVSIDRVELTNGTVTVAVRAKVHAGDRADVVVALTEDGVATAVARGENANHTLVNDAIVRWEGRAFAVDSSSGERSGTVVIPIPAESQPPRLGVTAFLQEPRTLSIYAAASRGPISPAARTRPLSSGR